MTKRGPQIPKWLSKEAQKEWRRVVPLIADRLTESDFGMVESYCVAVGTVRECQAILSRDGLIIETDHGPKSHPAARMLNQASTTVKGLGAELGLSPKSRRHSSDAPTKPEASGWEGYAS